MNTAKSWTTTIGTAFYQTYNLLLHWLFRFNILLNFKKVTTFKKLFNQQIIKQLKLLKDSIATSTDVTLL